MAEIIKITLKNGCSTQPFYVYKCDCCGVKILENFPYVKTETDLICGDCAFKNGVINENDYIKNFLYFIDTDKLRASVKEGEIYITTSKFPWEKTARDRDCKEYSEWRSSVFSRDSFTCVSCGKVGGKLNAHHIKEYSKYPELRYVIENGVTLCEECHRNEHKRRKSNGNI